jgi:hypothetical protein
VETTPSEMAITITSNPAMGPGKGADLTDDAKPALNANDDSNGSIVMGFFIVSSSVAQRP